MPAARRMAMPGRPASTASYTGSTMDTAGTARPSPVRQSSGLTGQGTRRSDKRRLRDRHGRGLRTPLLPPQLPGFRTRGELFDEAVIQAVADLEPRWPGQLSAIEFAVDEVPRVPADDALPSQDTVVDGEVPLVRFHPPGVDPRGRATKSRIVIYRRPVEMRAPAPPELTELITELLAEQLSAVLGESAD